MDVEAIEDTFFSPSLNQHQTEEEDIVYFMDPVSHTENSKNGVRFVPIPKELKLAEEIAKQNAALDGKRLRGRPSYQETHRTPKKEVPLNLRKICKQPTLSDVERTHYIIQEKQHKPKRAREEDGDELGPKKKKKPAPPPPPQRKSFQQDITKIVDRYAINSDMFVINSKDQVKKATDAATAIAAKIGKALQVLLKKIHRTSFQADSDMWFIAETSAKNNYVLVTPGFPQDAEELRKSFAMALDVIEKFSEKLRTVTTTESLVKYQAITVFIGHILSNIAHEGSSVEIQNSENKAYSLVNRKADCARIQKEKPPIIYEQLERILNGVDQDIESHFDPRRIDKSFSSLQQQQAIASSSSDSDIVKEEVVKEQEEPPTTPPPIKKEEDEGVKIRKLLSQETISFRPSATEFFYQHPGPVGSWIELDESLKESFETLCSRPPSPIRIQEQEEEKSHQTTKKKKKKKTRRLDPSNFFDALYLSYRRFLRMRSYQ